LLSRKKRSTITAALAVLMALPVTGEAAENVPEPGPFKARVIEMLKDNPFSVYWDGTASAPVDISSADITVKSGSIAHNSTDVSVPAEDVDFWEPAPKAEQEVYQPEIVVEEDTTLDLFEDNAANENAALYEYARGESYDVYAAPGFISDVQLKPGEQITGITIGDAISWSVETRLAADKTWHVYVKPLQLGVITNMIINTDSHYYSLRLIADSDYSPVVSWTYPGEAREEYNPQGISMEVESVQDINFDYSVSGKESWTPETVFDDGAKTYLILPDGAAARHTPVVFQKRAGLLLNLDYKIVNNTIILDRVCNEIFMATSNSDRVVIKNEHAVMPWSY